MKVTWIAVLALLCLIPPAEAMAQGRAASTGSSEASGVSGACEAIKKDTQEAQVRRDKVHYLGTIDCRYYPEAIAALAGALRTDGCESVRYEAAVSLGHNPCCSQKAIDALEASVSGLDKDSHPAERSARVRCASALALEKCLNSRTLPVDAESLSDDGQKLAGKNAARQDSQRASRESIDEAWLTLNEFNAMLTANRPKATSSETRSPAVKSTVPASQPQFMQSSSAPISVYPRVPVADSIPAKPALSAPVVQVTSSTALPEEHPEPKRALPVTQTPPAPTTVPAAPKILPAQVQTSSATVAAASANPMMAVVSQVLYGSTTAERHQAIRQLVRYDWQKNPVIMSALLAGAKNDKSPEVRVDCLRHMAVHHMAHPQIIAELGSLTEDADPWVREEATRTLTQLKQSQ